jgi:hypothetical protein
VRWEDGTGHGMGEWFSGGVMVMGVARYSRD